MRVCVRGGGGKESSGSDKVLRIFQQLFKEICGIGRYHQIWFSIEESGAVGLFAKV